MKLLRTLFLAACLGFAVAAIIIVLDNMPKVWAASVMLIFIITALLYLKKPANLYNPYGRKWGCDDGDELSMAEYAETCGMHIECQDCTFVSKVREYRRMRDRRDGVRRVREA